MLNFKHLIKKQTPADFIMLMTRRLILMIFKTRSAVVCQTGQLLIAVHSVYSFFVDSLTLASHPSSPLSWSSQLKTTQPDELWEGH